MGGYFAASGRSRNAPSNPYTLAILPYIEQKALYDAINFRVPTLSLPNLTIQEIGVATYWCPSDPKVSQPASINKVLRDQQSRFVAMRYSSYPANCGMLYLLPFATSKTRAQQIAELSGVIYEASAVRLADVTDGTSNTILAGERYREVSDDADSDRWCWWTSSIGMQFATMWPINPSRSIPDLLDPIIADGASSYLTAASSGHPGGANFSFCDGSVRFVKETINTWPIDLETGLPKGLDYSFPTGLYTLGSSRPGVYQALATRSGGELLSADAF